jgi:RNA polymerase sigma-B factor
MAQAQQDDQPNPPHTWGFSTDPADLFAKLDSTIDPAERAELHNRIIELSVPVADRLARRYRRGVIPMDDLQQVARTALVQATQRFEGGGEKAVLGFVVPTILGALKRHFRDHGWTIRPPRRIQEAHLAVRQAREELLGELRREPTADELATATDIPVETVRDVQMAAERCWPESLDLPRGEAGPTIADTLAVPDRSAEHADARLLVLPALRSLQPREREVIYLRYYQDRTQREVGQHIGVTQMQVSRIESKAMERLREGMNPNDDAAA